MFRLHRILKASALLAAAVLCTALSAQDIKVAVREPQGDVDKNLLEMVTSQFTTVISNTKGFQLFDRANVEQVVGEHVFQSDEFLVPSKEREGRELGQFKGADLVVTTKLSLYGNDLNIACQVQDIVSNEVVASSTRLVGSVDTRVVMDASKSLMEELLKKLNTKLSGGLHRGEPLPPLAGLDEEIKSILMENRGAPKWNKAKETATLEVDLSSVALAENRQHGALIYRVSGRVRFILDGAGVNVELEPFTEVSPELMKKRIKAQIQPKVNNIIRDLLSQLN